MNAGKILPLLRDLYGRHPEMRYLGAWELQHVFWSLGYADELLPEWEIAAAAEAPRPDACPLVGGVRQPGGPQGFGLASSLLPPRFYLGEGKR
jgi:hypothetical protein